jgi:hypothetical protein
LVTDISALSHEVQRDGGLSQGHGSVPMPGSAPSIQGFGTFDIDHAAPTAAALAGKLFVARAAFAKLGTVRQHVSQPVLTPTGSFRFFTAAVNTSHVVG